MILDFSHIQHNKIFEFNIWGSKNETLPLLFLASAIAYKDKRTIILENVSLIRDIFYAIKLLKDIWIEIDIDIRKKEVFIDGGSSILKNKIDRSNFTELRYWILLIWLLVSFFNTVIIPLESGWCSINGKRKSNFHYNFFESLGCRLVYGIDHMEIIRSNDKYNFSNLPDVGTYSTSFTENVIIFLVLNVSQNYPIHLNLNKFYSDRPEIHELLNFAKLFGYIFIHKNWILHSVTCQENKTLDIVRFRVMSDFDQLLFFIFLSLFTKNTFRLCEFCIEYKFEELRLIEKLFPNLLDRRQSGIMIINWNLNWKIINIKELEIESDHYPFISSDSQPILSLLSLFIEKVIIFDKRFENRYRYSDIYKLLWLSSKVESNRLVFLNKDLEINTLSRKLDDSAFDLYSIRESGLLIIHWAITKSILEIENSFILNRWYENIFSNLTKLWVSIL